MGRREVGRASHQSSAGADVLWQLTSDTASWPAWHSGCTGVELAGPLRCSARGRRLRRGGCDDFVVTMLVPGQTYAETVRLLGARVTSRRDLRSRGDGSELSVAVTLSGPLAWAYRRRLTTRLATSLPAELSRLATLAERAV